MLKAAQNIVGPMLLASERNACQHKNQQKTRQNCINILETSIGKYEFVLFRCQITLKKVVKICQNRLFSIKILNFQKFI
jgi:hypothetical protein